MCVCVYIYIYRYIDIYTYICIVRCLFLGDTAGGNLSRALIWWRSTD